MTIPARMRAAVSRRYGPPEVVAIEEIATPQPGPHDLLVRVQATTVNRTDCGYRGGKPFLIRFFSGLRRPKAPVHGTEFAGDVVAIGDEVTAFAVGDRVCGYVEGPNGAHAEYVLVGDHHLIAKVPAERSYVQAAPSMEGSHYALGFLRTTRAKPGWNVLIHGATGAIGSAAVPLAKAMGLTVTATCHTEHIDLVRGLGADRVIDHQSTDFTRDPERFDLVLDAVGKSSFRRCYRLLKPQGIYCSSDVGMMWHGPLLALITPLFRRRRVVFPIPKIDPDTNRFLLDQIASGAFTPVLDPHRFGLDEIADAYRFVETGQKIGNVVVEV